MATLTVDQNGSHIPGFAGRRLTLFRNTGSSTVYWSFNKNVTASEGPYQGLPLAPASSIGGTAPFGEQVAFGGDGIPPSLPVYFICDLGITGKIVWTAEG
jgi:hypothetical protein